MTSTALRASFTREAVERLSALKREPDWMLRRRLEAFELYESMGLPTRSEEEWRRTDLSRLRLDGYAPFTLEDVPEGQHLRESLPESLRPSADEGTRSALIVQHNSSSAAGLLEQTLQDRGVIVSSLDEAVRLHPDLVERYFMMTVPASYNTFTALHAAFWSGGTFIHVPRGVQVDLPIQGVLYGDVADSALFGHTLLIAEEGSRVTLVEESTSVGAVGESFSSSVTELVLGREAEVRYVSMQEFAPRAVSFSAQRAMLGSDSRLNMLNVSVGGAFSKGNVEAHLAERGARAEMLGLFFGNEDQFIDYHTSQEHIAPDTTSDLLYKGVLADRARSVFSGMIRVHPGAQKTDAYQTNRNLLLSDDARADSIPNLEIGANDVRCSHGATVSPIDEDEVFYLQSRGVRRSEATKIIVDGFFEPILARIPLESIQDRLRDFIDHKSGQQRYKGDL